MNNEEAIKELKDASDSEVRYGDIKHHHDEVVKRVEAFDMAIKALAQQQRDCNTCKHSDNGNCAYTEECHECMWKSKYEKQPCEDCISRQAVHEMLENIPINESDKWFNWLQRACLRLAELPSVTPKQAWWIRWYEVIESEDGKSTDYIPHCKCSECDTEYEPHSSQFIKYCPNCGAKMTEGEEV